MKFYWLNIIRVIAIICVIQVHVVADPVNAIGQIPNTDWWVINFYDSIARFCVPLFVMLSGALLLKEDYELGSFLKKRLQRILLPFLFWSSVYIAFLVLPVIHSLDVKEILKMIIKNFLHPSSYHLWYVYMIIGLYLFIPIIRKFIKIASQREIEYFLIVWLFTLFISPIYKYIGLDLNLSYFSGYIGYLVLGYYLLHTDRKIFRSRTIMIAAWLLGIAVTFIGTGMASMHKQHLMGDFYEYLTPNVALCAGAAFVLFQNLQQPSSKLVLWLINFICKYSYGVYLCHILILTGLNWIGITATSLGPVIISVPVMVFLTLIVSLILVRLIRVLPFGKYIAA